MIKREAPLVSRLVCISRRILYCLPTYVFEYNCCYTLDALLLQAGCI